MEKNGFIEFLLNAKKELDDSLSLKIMNGNVVSTLENSKQASEKFDKLIIGYNNEENIIPYELVRSYWDTIKKMNTSLEELSDVAHEEVDPYVNVGKRRETKKAKDEFEKESVDEVSKIVEDIISAIYGKYNYLILPDDDDDDSEKIDISKYVDGSYVEARESDKQKDNLYSMGLKLTAKYNNEDYFIPFKVYFTYNGGNVDFVEGIFSDSQKRDIMLDKVFNAKQKAHLEKKFNNNEFEEDRIRMSSNIEGIVDNILNKISEYVEKIDDDEASVPNWFKESKFGKFISSAIARSGDSTKIDVDAAFRYITQTPLPYKYVEVKFANSFTNESFFIRKASKSFSDKLKQLNICPNCGSEINEKNKIKYSREYEEGIIGCNSCFNTQCSDSGCNNVWDNTRKKGVAYNQRIGKNYFYKPGKCNSELGICRNKDCYGQPLCSEHARRCFDDSCRDIIYCGKVVVKCSNDECITTFCNEHAKDNLHKCEGSKCADKTNPKMYCDECAKTFLRKCGFCGKTICDDCGEQTVDNSGNTSSDNRICLECLALLKNSNNYEINKKNNVFIGDMPKRFYIDDIGKGDLYKYADIEGQYIFKDEADEGYKDTKENAPLWYRKDELKVCSLCDKKFKYLQKSSDESDDNLYCLDCLKKCSLCGKENVAASNCLEVEKEYYCKYCFNDKWYISNLDTNNREIEKIIDDPIKAYKANNNIVIFKEDDKFVCPETDLIVHKDKQVRICDRCKCTYSLANFDGEENKVCMLCEALDDFEKTFADKKQQKKLAAAFGKKLNDGDAFFCTKNTLMVKDNQDNLKVYRIENGKYKEVRKDE